MPERCRICDREPLRSRGIRLLYIGNYAAAFTVDQAADSVNVLRIIYSVRNLEAQLGENT